MSKHRTRGTRWSRLLSGVLCLALMLGLLPSAGLLQTAEAHWADPYGEQLVEWGVMSPSSNLRLSASITRAEFVAMCNRAFGYKKLGSTPFTDVPRSAWYAQDINIAYNAGYFMGTAANKASPNGTLTREQATVLIARNLRLQETVGEVIDFTDSHDLHEWSRGLIGAAVAEGMIGGYDDGSYRPNQSITRGEVAKMLVSVIGTPINKAGNYNEMGNVYGNLTISSSNVTLRNTVVAGNLYITGGVDLGNVLLENVTVLGRIVISGGGESHAGQSSVILRNVAAEELAVDSIIGQFTTISAYGITDIPVTNVRSSAWLEDASWPGYGLQYIELNGAPHTKLQLAGTIKEVVNKTPFSDLQLVQGTAQKITIDEYATNSTLLIDYNTRVDELTLDVATLVTGEGDITSLVIGASGCEVDILPDKVTIRPGITATVNGEVIGSTEAAELSSDPRLLAGYPKVTNLKPDEAQAQFAANKAGTIYWAVSELADGSVSEEHLVNNPAYGGIIYEGNSGNIAASSRNVYVEQLKKLKPDGSYYLTAMLEDGRGNRSPLKVISFTTPDNTKPEFLNGRISLETCEVVQLTGMANKSCTLYWVLLAQGAAAPTAQNFKSGTFGGNYGRGSLNVTKNVPVSINVNDRRLQEDTAYDLYVWLNDFDGAQCSQVYHFPVHTPDETPPVIIDIRQSDYGESDAQVTFKINEYPSTLYWAVVTEGKADTFITTDDHDDLFAKIKIESGATSIVHGSTPSRGANLDTDILKSVLKGLDYKTHGTHSFKLFCVAKDAAGNYSEWRELDIHTLDTDPPHAWLEFSDSTNGKPRAGSDIKIVFDEQVKGGANAEKTFLKLYEDAVNSGNMSNLKSQLEAHIQLWYVSTSGSATRVTASSPAMAGNGSGDWIDFSKAIITMEKGKLYITLPGSTRIENGVSMTQAINLQSGARYQFRLNGVFDDAFTPNGVAVYSDNDTYCIPPEEDKDGRGKASDNGNGWLTFATLYAQVELFENGMTKISSAGNTYDGYRLDVCVDVHPLSTSNIPDTEYWDLIMWCESNTEVEFEIYRRTVDDKGNRVEDWKLVSNKIPYDPNSDNGASFSAYKAATETPKIQKLTEGLKQGYTYTYGIHFTKVNKLDEGNEHKTDPEAWGGSVTMKFSVIAGAESPIGNVSRAVGNYNDYVNVRKTVSEIGVAYTATGGTDTILTCTPREFVDSQPPSFATGYPYFEASSAKVTMTVNTDLGRTGKMYYVVAPAPKAGSTLTSVSTSANGVPISTYTDPDKELGGNDRDKTNDKNKTFIPKDGGEREANAPYIQFKTGGPVVGGKATPGEYDSPKSSDITNSKQYDQVSDIIKAGSVELNGMITPVDFEGLRPSTTYYVYIVFQGAGRASNIVEIYQVTTKKVERPVVTISASGSIVTMTSDQDCELAFALVEKNKTLADWITKKSPSSVDTSQDSVLEQMVARQSSLNGASKFDDNKDTQLKLNVATYITGTGNTGGGSTGSTSDFRNWVLPRDLDGQTYNGVKYDKSVPVSAGVSITWDFNQYMTEGADYVVLVAARHFYGGTGGDDYGFAAVTDLHKQDTEPPKFKNKDSNNPGFLDASLSPYNPNNEVWTDHPENYAYSGSVVIEFTKDLYYFDDTSGVRKLYKVVFDKDTKKDDEKYILDIIGGSAVDNGRVSVTQTKGPVGNTITLKLANIRMGDTITFFRTGQISNGSSYFDSGMKLTLTFDPTLTAKDIRKAGKAELLMPGFWADWG